MRRSSILPHGWAAAVLCFMIEAARAQTGWMVVDAPHTRVHTDASPQAAVALAELAEATYHTFAAAFPYAPPPETRVEIVAFSGGAAFAPFCPNAFSPAYYTRGAGGDRIVLRLDLPGAASYYRHEYVHLLLRRAGLRLPMLLEEGMAEVWSDVEFAGHRVQVGRAAGGRLQRTGQVGLLQASVILERDRGASGDVSMTAASLRYAQAAALAHLLMFDERLEPGYGDLLALLTDGADAETAVRTVYGLGLADLDALLAEHCRRKQFPRWEFPAPEAVRPELTARSDAGAGIELAFLRQRLDELRPSAVAIPAWAPQTLVRLLNTPAN
jgi:hypothetical protein